MFKSLATFIFSAGFDAGSAYYRLRILGGLVRISPGHSWLQGDAKIANRVMVTWCLFKQDHSPYVGLRYINAEWRKRMATPYVAAPMASAPPPTPEHTAAMAQLIIDHGVRQRIQQDAWLIEQQLRDREDTPTDMLN